MTHSLQAVIWDLDGVLVDTGEMHLQAFQETLPAFGIAFSPEIFRNVFGMGNHETLVYLTGKEPDPALEKRIIETKESRFRDLIRGRARPLPGVLDWLEKFKQMRMRQAVATSAPQENVDALMAELRISGYFEVILSAPGNGLPAKPEPDVFIEAARRLGVDPAACLVIEDSPAGIEAARKAGMTCLAVTNTCPREQLGQADRVIDSLAGMDLDWFAESSAGSAATGRLRAEG
jgi:HAD superfamily hydrolase (TIGR01509 family)